jgi:TonB family protein
MELTSAIYPIESLLANEEGSLAFSVVIDPEGKVAAIIKGTSTGSAVLDTQAYATVQRWRFAPATYDGRTIHASLDLNLTWKLPLESAEPFLLPEDTDMPEEAFAVDGSPPKKIRGSVYSSDYPSVSVSAGEAGETMTKVLIGTTGDVEKAIVVDSSGYKRLDDAALKTISRFKYTPGTVRGRPTAMWSVIRVTFRLYDTGPGRFCHFKPFAERNARHMSDRNDTTVTTSPWYLINADGTIGELLMLTEEGWMRWSAPMVERLNQGRRRTPPPRLQGERRTCWIDNVITVEQAGAN